MLAVHWEPPITSLKVSLWSQHTAPTWQNQQRHATFFSCLELDLLIPPLSHLCTCSQIVASPWRAASPLSQCQLICWFPIKPYILYSLFCPSCLPLESSYSSFTYLASHQIHIEPSKLPGILFSAEDTDMEYTLPFFRLLVISPWGQVSKQKEEHLERVLR